MKKLITAAVMLCAAGSAGAAPLGTTVTATGGYGNSLSLLTDGVFPPDGTAYNAPTSVYFGPVDFPNSRIAVFTFDFGGLVNVTGINADVDNNDDYIFSFFNGATPVSTYIYGAGSGTVGFGLQNFSTAAPGPSSPDTPAFTPVNATSATVTGANGDRIFGIGEVDFIGSAIGAAVPEPATWAMMLLGFGMVGGAVRGRRRRAMRVTYA